MRQVIKHTLLDAVTPVAITSSTDATPIVVTSTAHGFATGDRAFIFGHTTNIAANGIFKVTKLTANTFSLQDEFTGNDVAGSGAGAGASGACMKAPQIEYVQDYRAVDFQIITSGTATTTLLIAGSPGKVDSDIVNGRKDLPNFGATISKSNPYSYLQVVNLDSGATVNGSTGVVVAGTDINLAYESNTNIVRYLTVIPTSWTTGAITVILTAGYF
jgi:hypothetical protein